MANNNGIRKYLITIICGLTLILGISLPVCATSSQNVTVIGSPLIIYHLNISSTSGGNVSVPGEGTFNYVDHSVKNISAVANSCYHFAKWTGNTSTIADMNASSTTITMNGSYTIQANFATDQYTLTYNASTGGTINGTPSQTVNCSESGSAVRAMPNASYHFVNWSDGLTANPRTDTLVTHNITVTANFRLSGGGGGSTASTSIDLNILGGSSTGTIDSSGVFQGDVDAASPDGKIAIHIASGTTALGKDGNPLTGLDITTVSSYPTPPDGRTVIAAFDFQPNGATFDPAIQITITYDPSTLPSGTQPSDLVIAFFNTATGHWEYVSGLVDPVAHTITYSISHFTVFAVMGAATSSAAPTMTPTPTPTLIPTPTPTAAATPTVIATPTSTSTPMPTLTPRPTSTVVHQPGEAGKGLGDWAWIVIGFVVILALIVMIRLVMRRRTTGGTSRSESEEK